MKTTLKLFLTFLLVSSLQIGAYAQDQTATLPNGKKVILHANKTWEYELSKTSNYDYSKLKDNEIPEFLRQGISVDKQTLTTATEMYLDGWRYTMPRPKSTQARWGHSDGRTTWWYGHWYNNKTKRYSDTTPKKQADGTYKGDYQNSKGSWRRGGSPAYPSKIDWLLSTSGGVKPRN